MGSGLAQERAPERRVTRNEAWYNGPPRTTALKAAGVMSWCSLHLGCELVPMPALPG
jgi:hypothetical protein